MKDVFATIEESYSWEQNDNDQLNDADFFKQAETCGHFKEGMQMSFDCDREETIENVKEDTELYELLKEKGYGNG